MKGEGGLAVSVCVCLKENGYLSGCNEWVCRVKRGGGGGESDEEHGLGKEDTMGENGVRAKKISVGRGSTLKRFTKQKNTPSFLFCSVIKTHMGSAITK